MSKSDHIAKSALVIIIFSLFGKVLGFIREILIASKFGSGMETDTFFVALAATGLITGFLSNAISTTVIPILSEIEVKEGKTGKIKHSNNIINIIFLISAILVTLGIIASPFLIKLVASGFQGEQYDLAVKLTRMGMPMILFSGVTGVFTGYLQSEQRFAAPAAVELPYNLVYILFLLFLSSIFGIKGLMVATVIAVASQVLIQIPDIKKSGYRHTFKLDFKDRYVKKIILLALPVLLGVAVHDLNAIVDRTLASRLIEGSISALNYADKLNNIILGVFITAITTVIFPLLSKESNTDNMISMKKIMGYGINIILVITIPASVGLIVLATPIVEIAFQRGAFDGTATLMTSQALIFYSVGLIAAALNIFITRVYYSIQDTKTPVVYGIVAVALNIILNIILVRYMQHSGLALATSISTTVSAILLIYSLKKKIGSLGTKDYITTFIKSGAASIIMGICVYIIYNQMYKLLGISGMNNLISFSVAVGIGILIYVVASYMFGIESVKNVLDTIKAKIKK